ncbi:hypothetical protein [Paraburkholderia atlantica]|uniref:hypothetical protein n=1 Tax=Paraburkholderia atlantica TaxID=2654982 RepID=UPI0016127A5E|nr:hypothetical protein [Paraburkholderia atlantica]MBB5414079.1 hypothetical protein [Paraburkholderia atlantica]
MNLTTQEVGHKAAELEICGRAERLLEFAHWVLQHAEAQKNLELDEKEKTK